MANIVNVKKLNVEFKAIIKMLEANGMSLEEIKNDKQMMTYFKQKTGIDFNTIRLDDSYTMRLDLDKVMAVGEIEEVQTLPGVKGFTIWFDHDASHCWCLDADCYDDVISKFY